MTTTLFFRNGKLRTKVEAAQKIGAERRAAHHRLVRRKRRRLSRQNAALRPHPGEPRGRAASASGEEETQNVPAQTQEKLPAAAKVHGNGRLRRGAGSRAAGLGVLVQEPAAAAEWLGRDHGRLHRPVRPRF